MDTEIKLIPGGVYQTPDSDRPRRVIAFDEIEVLYDVYWPGVEKWSFTKRNGFYYRSTPSFFLKDATFLREQPLTNEELKIFRPDLPFRLCRNKRMKWADKLIPKLEDFRDYAKNLGVEDLDQIALPTPQITLRPYGKKGTITSLKSTLVSAISDRGFSCIELLWLAHNIQAPHIKTEQENGVGIFRSGHEKKVPAYYIGGYYDAANFIPKES